MEHQGFRVLNGHSNGTGAKPGDPDWTREFNEKVAIIQGMAQLLLETEGSLDDKVARAALEAIRRHAVGLRGLIRHD